MSSSLSRHTVLLVVVLCGTALPTISQTPATQKKSSGAVVTGKVTIKGKAAPGIVITARVMQRETGNEPTFKGTTDQDGKYRISDVLPGTYELMSVAPAFVGKGQTVVLTEGESVDGIDFALVRGGVITGKVTDADGRPVVEQTVSLIAAEPPRDPRSPVYSFSGVQTDDRGVYRMFGLAAGRYKVSVGQGTDNFFVTVSGRPSYKQTFHPDVSDAAKATVVEVTEGGEASNVDIAVGRATQTFAASGRVINGESGQPIPNLRFGVQYIVDDQRRQYMGAFATSNSNGEFRVEGLGPGKYGFFMMQQPETGLRADAVAFEVLDQDVTDLVIKTSPGISVAGTIVLENPDDKAALAKLLQLTVTGFVQSEAPTGNISHSATINADGSFLLQGLEAGKLFISLNAARDRTLLKGFTITRTERDGVVQPRGVEIKNGDPVSGVKVVVSYGNASIRGVVKVENGTLPAGARFFVQVTKPGERFSMIRPPPVDARGHFVMEGIAAGTYDFTVTMMGPPVPGVRPPRVTQQVSVVDGVVNDVTITLDLNQNQRPSP